MDNILSKAHKKNNGFLSPLWLSYVCNELKIFGEFSTINKKIENFPIDHTELIVQILKRVNADFPKNLVIDVHFLNQFKDLFFIRLLIYSILNRFFASLL
jgi:hypothetical protein